SGNPGRIGGTDTNRIDENRHPAAATDGTQAAYEREATGHGCTRRQHAATRGADWIRTAERQSLSAGKREDEPEISAREIEIVGNRCAEDRLGSRDVLPRRGEADDPGGLSVDDDHAGHQVGLIPGVVDRPQPIEVMPLLLSRNGNPSVRWL